MIPLWAIWSFVVGGPVAAVGIHNLLQYIRELRHRVWEARHDSALEKYRYATTHGLGDLQADAEKELRALLRPMSPRGQVAELVATLLVWVDEGINRVRDVRAGLSSGGRRT